MQQIPEMRQREMRQRAAEVEQERIALLQRPPRRVQPGELDRCSVVTVAKTSTPGEVEEALKREPAWLPRLAEVQPPADEYTVAGIAAVALVVGRRPGIRCLS